MDNNSSIDKKIIEELNRYNSINNYITEQEATLPPTPEELPAGEVGTDEVGDLGVTPPVEPNTVDVESDPDVEKIGDDNNNVSDETDMDSGTEELDITELVNSQKNVEQKQEEYFDNLFQQLDNLQSKLSNMDNIVNQLNNLETKIEKYRPKTPEEKLELRSLDSGPFKQKLSDFFIDKQKDMEESGKNEYVLTSDDIKDFSQTDVKNSFRDFDNDELNLNM
jgi:DNA repair exonuclease SbcCD ATPase subunit